MITLTFPYPRLCNDMSWTTIRNNPSNIIVICRIPADLNMLADILIMCSMCSVFIYLHTSSNNNNTSGHLFLTVIIVYVYLITRNSLAPDVLTYSPNPRLPQFPNKAFCELIQIGREFAKPLSMCSQEFLTATFAFSGSALWFQVFW